MIITLDRPSTGMTARHIVVCNWRESRHPQAGGAELYCEEVARRLHRLGERVTLVTSRPPGTSVRESVDYGQVVRLGRTYTTYARVLIWLWVHRRQIDCVIDSENGIPYFSPLVLPERIPIVLLIHHVHQQQFERYFPPIVAGVGKWIEKYGTRVVYRRRTVCVVSPSARAEVRRQLAFPGPVIIAPNGLTVAQHGCDVPRSVDPRIVCVGRLALHKRFELLIEAMPSLLERWPTLHLDLVGQGDAQARLAREVQELGLNQRVTLHGRLSQLDRDRLIGSAWLTVNPSAGEGWGLSVMEAAALGVPAVAFRVPGLQDSVRHEETGWLVDEPRNLASAVDQALLALSDPDEAARWAERCRKWTATFTWESTAERILAALASEGDRLAKQVHDRRRRSDSTTVVQIPLGLVTAGLLEQLRRLDQVRVGGEGVVELLLGNSDEHDAERALFRLGLPSVIGSTARVARPYDLLGWLPKERLELDEAEHSPMSNDGPGVERKATTAQAIELQRDHRDSGSSESSRSDQVTATEFPLSGTL